MKFLSLCSGIGGFDWGVMLAGHQLIGYAECDTECKKCKTYTQHSNHPTKPFYTICNLCGHEKNQPTHKSFSILHDPERRLWNAYDIRSVSDDAIRRLGESTGGGVQLIVGGFPCQAFSIAGKREGFRDATRGTLVYEIFRFASILRPRNLLLENVEGLLNHDGGKTFETILSALDELGYDAEWQVHNSSAYVPQNRERVFIVGHLRGISSRKVFPFGRENSNSVEVIGRVDIKADDYCKRVYSTEGLSPCLPTMQGGSQEPKIMVAGQLNDDTGGTGKIYDPAGIAPTQLAQHGNAVTKVLVTNQNDQLKIREISTCLDANYYKGLDCHQMRTGVMEAILCVNPRKKDGSQTYQQDRVYNPAGMLPALTAQFAERMNVVEPRAVLTPDREEKRQNERRFKEPGEPCFTLTAQDKHGVYDGYRIRKLTPLECFRLQSYPDEWYVTLKLYNHLELIPLIDMSVNNITYQTLLLIQERGIKEGMSDSQLYKMAGNGVTSLVAWDISRRFEEAIE